MIKRASFCLLFLFLLLSCADNEDAHQKDLDRAESYLEKHPSLTIAITDSLLASNLPTPQFMKCILLKAEAQNKAFVKISSKEDVTRCMGYYESRGTVVEKVRAYYMAGCAYRDSKEVAKALEYYQKAVDEAKQESSPALSKLRLVIYGQMAEIYLDQNLAQDHLTTLDEYIKLARANGNIYDALIASSKKAETYVLLCRYKDAIDTGVKAYKEFLKHGYKVEAGRSLVTPIHTLIDQGDFSSAKKYLAEFDRLAAKADTNKTTVIPYFRGLCAIHDRNTAKAKGYFDSLLPYGSREAAYRGLMLCYQQWHNADSVVKYSQLYAAANDESHNHAQSAVVDRMSKQYDYNQFQEEVAQEKIYSKRLENRLLGLFLLFVLSCIVGFIFIKKYRIKKAQEVKKFKDLYSDALEKLSQIEQRNDLHQFRASDIVQRFIVLAKPTRNQKAPTKEDWEEALCTARNMLPRFASSIPWERLNDREKNVLLLMVMGMKNTEIKALLPGLSDQMVSNLKSSINQKLFDDHSAKTLEINLQGLTE